MMANFEAISRTYKLEDERYKVDEDRLVVIEEDYVSIFVRHDLEVDAVTSLRARIDDLRSKEQDKIQKATKIYVVGGWSTALPIGTCTEAVSTICKIIKEMTSLKELTWISSLPFMEPVWAAVPNSLTTLVIDIGVPIRVNAADSYHETHISQDAMKPLTKFTKLRELRVFGMWSSFQSIIWETVFRNDSSGRGMYLLDLQMASAPIIRQDHWVKGEDVSGLVVSNDHEGYKGIDGKGILYHNYGFGEYLDIHCMRQARIASGLQNMKPIPLEVLKLDGFVIDQSAFEHEFSHIWFLTCGEKCVDAGSCASWTQGTLAQITRKLSEDHDGVCFVQWPNWGALYHKV